MADRSRRGLILALLVAGALPAWASGGSAQAQPVTVRAKLTFEKQGVEFGKLRLAITRSGRTWRSGPLGSAFIVRPQVHAVR